MVKMVVRSWKASIDDLALLKALKEAKIQSCESDRVRAGLRALAREHLVVFDDR